MKQILIVGANSYIGKSFKKWIIKNGIDFKIDSISLRDEKWKNIDLSKYDSIIYLAAIVHSPNASSNLYYEINRDLTLKFASYAKKKGIKQFIFFSTLSVYGLNEGEITLNTKLNPTNDYGKSKLEAEIKLLAIEDNDFKVSIIRSPLVYGPGCPGNFSKLLKLFDFLPLFPEISNNRSMIFIDNMSSFLYLLILNDYRGIYIPENHQSLQIVSIYKHYRKNKRKMMVVFPIGFLESLLKKNRFTKKIFGDLIIKTKAMDLPVDYNIIGFEKSMKDMVNKTDT